MTKGSGTRSGLLWEVERLLDECTELPQVLLMENVPQVIGNKNIKDFQSWRSKLESLGYSNFVQLLNAKDYGIPQNRNRCFMVSLLGDWHYTFPTKKKLKLRLKDMLEDNVDEKYYLSDEVIKNFVVSKEKNDVGYIEKGTGQHQSNTIYSAEGCSRTIQATDWKDPQLVSHAIRGGGRGSLDRHQWDLVKDS